MNAALIATRSPGFMRWTWSGVFGVVPVPPDSFVHEDFAPVVVAPERAHEPEPPFWIVEQAGDRILRRSLRVVFVRGIAEVGVDVAKQGNGGILIEMGFSTFGREHPAPPDAAIDESGLAKVEARPANLVLVFGLSALGGLLELRLGDARQLPDRVHDVLGMGISVERTQGIQHGTEILHELWPANGDRVAGAVGGETKVVGCIGSPGEQCLLLLGHKGLGVGDRETQRLCGGDESLQRCSLRAFRCRDWTG